MYTCRAPECNRTDIKGYGYCNMHYQRLKAHGHIERTQTPHGMTLEYPDEYRVYRGLMTRCYNKKDPSYKNYGGRGIEVCERWLGPDGFPHFLEDMGVRPNGSLSIDRIDVNGDYATENCRWATAKEQANNRRNSRLITYKDKTLTISEWADKIGVRRHTLEERIRRGEPLETALTRETKIITGELAALAREHGIKYLVLYKRLKRGWTLEEALTVPPQKSRHWRKIGNH